MIMTRSGRTTLFMSAAMLFCMPGVIKAEEVSKDERLIRIEKEVSRIADIIDRIEFGGGVAGYYQGANIGENSGVDYGSENGFGYVADLELSFSPIENGSVYLRGHAGEGDGVDGPIEEFGLAYADLNTINDDNPGDGDFDLLEAYYTHEFFDGKFSFTVGKTEPVAFIDDNAFANDEVGQFVGKAFVNNLMLDTEDEFAPILVLNYSPSEQLLFTALAQSSSRPRLEQEEQKDAFKDIFSDPFVAAQITYSPTISDRQGNYRLYGFLPNYDQPEILGDEKSKGWGLGLSLDQRIGEKVGLFGRFGYSNDDVYENPLFLSGGLNLQGFLESRADDEMGIGYAALLINDDLEDNDTEHHVEVYYRYVISENLAIGPHFQLAVSPGGNKDNDEIIGGMLKADASF